MADKLIVAPTNTLAACDNRTTEKKKRRKDPSYQSLAAPIKSPVDKFALLPAFLKVRGLVKQHLDSYNYFLTKGIQKIMRANNRIVFERDPNYHLTYTSIRVGKPSLDADATSVDLAPHFCRLTDRTYAAPILVNFSYTRGNETRQQENVVIGRIPIMLRSSRCVLSGKDEAELAKLGECPLDPGGYFIVKGNEKVILIQEQLSKNRIIIDTDNKGREGSL